MSIEVNLNLKTLNGESLIGTTDIVIGSSITVGTTPISSGGVNRLLFENSANKVSQNANLTFNGTLLKWDGQSTLANSEIFNISGGGGQGAIRVWKDGNSGAPSIRVGSNSDFISTKNSITGESNNRFYGTAHWVFEGSSASTGWVGIGSVSNPGARLDVRAQGALSTDLAFRVRNSANTIDNFVVDGKGHISARANNNTQLYIGGSNTDNAHPSYYSVVVAGYSNINYGFRTTILGSENTFGGTQYGTIVGTRNVMTSQGVVIGDSNTTQAGITIGNSNSNKGGQSAILLGNNNTVSATNGYPTKPLFVIGSNINVPNDININNAIYFGTRDTLDVPHAVLKHDNFMIGSMYPTLTNYDTNSRGVYYTKNAIVPTSLPTDSIAFYSNDIVAGNAAPHFRTEVGDIIKLYKQSSAGISTISDIVTVLTNLGLLG